MEQDWVAKQEQRKNARWMKLAIVIAVLTGILQTIALARLPKRKPGDPTIMVTLEDVIYTFPNGMTVVVDRQTRMTFTHMPDGTFLINGKPVKLNH